MCCYRFVIGIVNFTRLRDSTCGDNGEHFACPRHRQVHNSRKIATKRVAAMITMTP